MAIKTVLDYPIAERTSAEIIATLNDEFGNGIDGALLTTLTLTLYIKKDKTQIINSRNNQDVLNTNDVTVDSFGNLTWLMTPLDNAIINDTKDSEIHVALFSWTWSAGTKTGRHEIEMTVQNMDNVP